MDEMPPQKSTWPLRLLWDIFRSQSQTASGVRPKGVTQTFCLRQFLVVFFLTDNITLSSRPFFWNLMYFCLKMTWIFWDRDPRLDAFSSESDNSYILRKNKTKTKKQETHFQYSIFLRFNESLGCESLIMQWVTFHNHLLRATNKLDELCGHMRFKCCLWPRKNSVKRLTSVSYNHECHTLHHKERWTIHYHPLGLPISVDWLHKMIRLFI